MKTLIHTPPSLPMSIRSTIALVVLLLVSHSYVFAAQSYPLNVYMPTLKVGEPLRTWDGVITISRPSPGDPYSYRLPHTVVVTGELPPGLELTQKGPNYYDLPRIGGTATQSGIWTFELQATMADGLTTDKASVTVSVTDPQSGGYTIQTTGMPRMRQGEPVNNDPGYSGYLGTHYPNSWHQFFAPLNSVGLVGSDSYALRVPLKVVASGLPSGVVLETTSTEGYYRFAGSPSQAGKFDVKVDFAWLDGVHIASSTVSLEVLPADKLPSIHVCLYHAANIMQNVDYGRADYNSPAVFWVEDELGSWRLFGSAHVTFAATGLPPGMSVNREGGLVGKPSQAGTFLATVSATVPDGRVAPATEFQLTVFEFKPLSEVVGSYDCLVDRSEMLNGNNGGRLRMNVSSGGKVSGYLVRNFVRYPFANDAVKFDRESGETSISPPRSGVTVRGHFTEANEQGYYNQGNVSFFGEITDEVSFASVKGLRAVARTASSPSPFASAKKLNLVFVNESPQSNGQPSGAGFLSVTVSALGNATATVWAADGSAPVSMATTLSEDGYGGAYFPASFIIPNSSGSGTLQGRLFVNLSGDAAGELSWYQAPSNRGSAPGGIALVNYNGVIGSHYTPEPAGLNLLGLEQSIIDAQLDLMGEDVPTTSELSLTLRGADVLAKPLTGMTASKVVLNKKTGILTGLVTVPAKVGKPARTLAFRGIRSPKGSGIIGHFSGPSAANPKVRTAGLMKVGAP
jgi:hypothetical protein